MMSILSPTNIAPKPQYRLPPTPAALPAGKSPLFHNIPPESISLRLFSALF